MKKQFIVLIAVLLIFGFESNAQAQWLLTGNTPNGTDFLGELFNDNQPLNLKTEDSKDINFYTSAGNGTFNNQRMIITGGGNVGIGTTTPSNLLDVFSGSGSAQLRISYNSTVYTAMQTTNAGYFKFAPTSFRVGVNTDPTASLDVYPHGTGDDPLRLQNLNSDNTLTDVLVVVPSGGTNPGTVKKRDISSFVSTCASTTQNYVPKFCSTTTSIQNSLIFDNGTNVGIGLNSGFTGTKFEVKDDNSSAKPIYASSSGSGANVITAVGTGATSAGVVSTGKSYGVYATANGTYPAGGSPMGGIWAIADGTNNSGTGNSGNVGAFGLVETAQSTSDNYGVWGLAKVPSTGSSTINNYGVRGTANSGDNDYGVYGQASGGTVNWAGYFAGDVQITGDLWHGAVKIFSDENLKTDVEPINNASDILSQIQPHSFYYDTDNYGYMGLPTEKQFGVIAQEVEQVDPDLVGQTTVAPVYDADGNLVHDAITVKGVNYNSFIPLLIKGYQEQQSQISDLQNQINDLQSQLDGCCGQPRMGSSDSGAPENVNNQSVELKSSEQNYLGQSIPNPHKDQCTIPYYIDESITSAVIVFNDEMGREVNRVELVGHGNGQLTVLSSNLADGIYTYSLIADGKVIDTKKMVKQH